jgi:DNA-binding transcriptional LysR family regulator
VTIELRHLRAALAVAEELNFTRAAGRLHVTQQALSATIRQLELRAGCALFERDSHQVALTSAGHAFLGHARRALAEAERAVDAAREAARSGRGRLRLGFTATSALGIAPAILHAFAAARPEITIHLERFDLLDPSAGLHEGLTDAAFVRPPFSAGDDLRFETILEEPRVAVLPRKHPLTSRTALEAADLLDEPWFEVPGADPLWLDFWTLADRRDGRPIRYGGRITRFDDYLRGIRSGLAIGLVPGTTGEQYSRSYPDLVFLPVSDIAPCSLGVAWRAHQEGPLVSALVEIARQVCREHASPQVA